MKRSYVLFFVVFVSLGLFFIPASGTKVQDNKYSHVKVQKCDVKSSSGSAIVKRDPDFGNIPLYFMPNKGQVDEKARFYAKTSSYTLWMTKEGLVFDSMKSTDAIEVNEDTGNNHSKFKIQNSKLINRDVSRLVFLDANKNPEMAPIEMTVNKVNYFKGKDPSKWRTGIQTSKAVLYKGVYKDIDLKVYGIEKQVEYDWIVKPGADPKAISFKYEQVPGTLIDKEGNLVVETKFGELMHKKPVSYQVIDGKRVPVKSTFKKAGKNTYGFKVKKYNKDFELIIDPMVYPIYSTYLGGSNQDEGWSIAVDSDGYAYVTGRTQSTDFPTKNPYQGTLNDYYDVFVTKLSPIDGCPVYSTYLGGSSYDYGYGIAVDSDGYAYVTGDTGSSNFPTKNPYQGTYGGGSYDVFVTKLSPGGDTLLYSTYLGGGGSYDWGRGIAVDSNGSAYVTGYTDSTDFPTKNPYQDTSGGGACDAFVTKLSPGGNTLLYSTYLGGSSYDWGQGIAVDMNGSAYVTGETYSGNFPTENPYQGTLNGPNDVFVTKLSPGGNTLLYSTYMGGESKEKGYGIVVDGNGSAYVTGHTNSSDFPTKNPYQGTYGGGLDDAFVTKLSPGGNTLLYSTYLGGSRQDLGLGIAVDSNGSAYVTGYTDSTNFPTKNPYQGTRNGSADVFVTKLSPGGNTLWYSTYLGGNSDDCGFGITVDRNGSAYVTGYTYSTNFPTQNACQNSFAGAKDAFVARLFFCDSAPVLVVNKTLLNFAVNSSGYTTGPQGLLIRNIGSGTLEWTVGDNAAWLECSPTSGTNCGVVEVWLGDLSGLVIGSNTAEITISDPKADNSPLTVYVTTRVYAPGSEPDIDKPFGAIETPLDNSIVNGGVPFTGWALDDIGVVKVQLYREDGSGLIYIGDALFVEGARPDVAQVYPYYPYATRAGWGCLMLTNVLPDGPYNIHAVAEDIEGNRVDLGIKSIIINNASDIHPFGTIDMPAPGGNAAGSDYRVHGWALTHSPDTIVSAKVFIDGVDLGYAPYGDYRPDVCQVFPGYTCDAGFHFYFNPFAYSNGLHTIHCIVTDSGSDASSIGSRYFNILNLGTTNSVSQASSQKLYSMPEIIKIPVDYSGPVEMKKGFKPNIEPGTVYPGEKGNITIEVKELERIVIHLDDIQAEVEEKGSKNSKFYSGYMVVGQQLWSLPIGSTLDSQRGIFYWLPGPGFIGEYRFVFVKKEPNGAMNKKLINVNIVPKFGK